jgi:two-component system response regulator YesN
MYKALVVDDELSVKRSLKKIIEVERLPFEIVGEASDGKEALAYIEEAAVPDLVITDICMPVMDGMNLAREIKERDQQIEIVMISGYSNFDYAQQAIRYGVADYLLKPVETDEVVQTLNGIAEKLQKKKKGMIGKSKWISIFKLRLKSMIKLLRVLNEAAVIQEVEEMHKELMRHGFSTYQLKELYMDFLALMSAEISEISGNRIIIPFYEEYESLLHSDLILKKTVEILVRWMDEIRESRNWSSYKHMTKAVEYIKEFYTKESFSLKEAADIAGMSPTYFSKSFKEEMGISYTEYISNLRMKKAIELLEDPYNKVYEVAYAIGYSNYAHFAKVFKKNYGISPTDYRNKLEGIG